LIAREHPVTTQGPGRTTKRFIFISEAIHSTPIPEFKFPESTSRPGSRKVVLPLILWRNTNKAQAGLSLLLYYAWVTQADAVPKPCGNYGYQG
jgi:hypothetical protein